MIVAMALSTALVFVTVLVHYEVLRYTSILLPGMTIAPRQRILFVIAAVFIAHTIEVWLYACAYFLVTHNLGIGSFGGMYGGEFQDYLYFSMVTYTSLGLGDVYPVGGLRLMAGMESLTGLLMIAWSASFTYLSMEKFWDMHGRKES
jgi:hypothetical protein